MKLRLYYLYRIHEAKRYLTTNSHKEVLKEELATYPELNSNTFGFRLMWPLFFGIDVVKNRR